MHVSTTGKNEEQALIMEAVYNNSIQMPNFFQR